MKRFLDVYTNQKNKMFVGVLGMQKTYILIIVDYLNILITKVYEK